MVVVVGCGGKPEPRPTPTWPPRNTRHVHVPAPLKPEGPRLRLVGFGGPAWPLVGAPSVEPHHRVTSPWYASCDRRGRLHDDELAYVEAWCRYRSNSSLDLTRLLVPLYRTQLPRLAEAIRRDLANYLADTVGGSEALEAN